MAARRGQFSRSLSQFDENHDLAVVVNDSVSLTHSLGR